MECKVPLGLNRLQRVILAAAGALLIGLAFDVSNTDNWVALAMLLLGIAALLLAAADGKTNAG